MEYHLEIGKKQKFISAIASFLSLWAVWLIGMITMFGLSLNRSDLPFLQAITDPYVMLSGLLRFIAFLVLLGLFQGLRIAFSSNKWHDQPIKLSVNSSSINVTYNDKTINIAPDEISGFIKNPICWTLYFFKSPAMFLPKSKFTNTEWVSLSNSLVNFRKQHLTNRSSRDRRPDGPPAT